MSELSRLKEKVKELETWADRMNPVLESMEGTRIDHEIRLDRLEENNMITLGDRLGPITFGFEEALRMMKDEHGSDVKLTREGWNGKDMWIMLQTPTPRSKMSLPYIFMKTADDEFIPWLASQTDMMANDWYEVEEW